MTTAQVTVQLPAGGATSSALPVSILTPAPDAVAYQITPSHSGAINFNNVTLPSTTSKWSVNVGGKPSFALIAAGKVFVTVSLGSGQNSGSEILALDQATGATVWGPILVSGTAGAAYENGTVFVLSSPFATAGTLYAYDANTGNQKWVTSLGGQWSFTAGVTALNGMVYTGAAGSGADF